MFSPENQSFQTKNEQMKSLIFSLPQVAASSANILITGESGTGKEVLARRIHEISPRSNQEFIAINCAAIPETLLESELFGYKRGAFTGAISDKRGLFEVADKGTLFLDEVGELPLSLQAKLLRVLQDRRIRNIGGSTEKKVDFKLIAATHKNLRKEVEEGRFRQDLFFRLNVIPLAIPPLRERPDDIPVLLNKFIRVLSKKYMVEGFSFSEGAIGELMRRNWRGNVRELENLVEQILVMSPEKHVITTEDLPAENINGFDPLDCGYWSKMPTLAELEDKYIDFILERVSYHQGEAARILGLSRRTIYRKLSSNAMER